MRLKQRRLAPKRRLLNMWRSCESQQDQQRAEQERQKALQAEAAAEQAEKEKEQLRAQLLEQFNRILPTTDTPRGLKVNMADVLFDFGKYRLETTGT